MTGVLIFSASLLTGIGVWLLGMRRYLQQHGGTVVTGATLWLGAWADWQQCRDFALDKKDSRALRWANVFLLTQVGIVVGVALTICGI